LYAVPGFYCIAGRRVLLGARLSITRDAPRLRKQIKVLPRCRLGAKHRAGPRAKSERKKHTMTTHPLVELRGDKPLPEKLNKISNFKDYGRYQCTYVVYPFF
jgi:hypothetical protein